MRKVLVIILILLLPSALIYPYMIRPLSLRAYKPKKVLAVNNSSSSRSSAAASRGGMLRTSEAVKKADANSNIIKAMTYNIHRGINKSGKLNLEDISDLIMASEADIIALQEVERHSIRTRFKDQIEILSKNLSMHYAYGKSINILNGQYGNAILSRYPIEEYKVFELPYEKERRTLIRALINVNGYKLYAYSTHLGLNASERERQFEAIKRIIEDSEFDHILMGDFNSSADKLTSIYDILTDTAKNPEEAEVYTFESEKYSERIDYIFLSSNLLPLSYRVIKSDASDHYPVIAEIQAN